MLQSPSDSPQQQVAPKPSLPEIISEAVRDHLWHHQRLSTTTSEIIYGSLRDHLWGPTRHPSQPPQRGGVPKWQCRRRRFLASQQRISGNNVTGLPVQPVMWVSTKSSAWTRFSVAVSFSTIALYISRYKASICSLSVISLSDEFHRTLLISPTLEHLRGLWGWSSHTSCQSHPAIRL